MKNIFYIIICIISCCIFVSVSYKITHLNNFAKYNSTSYHVKPRIKKFEPNNKHQSNIIKTKDIYNSQNTRNIIKRSNFDSYELEKKLRIKTIGDIISSKREQIMESNEINEVKKQLEKNKECSQFEKLMQDGHLVQFNKLLLERIQQSSDTPSEINKLLHLRTQLLHEISRCRCIQSFVEEESEYDKKIYACMKNTEEQLNEFLDTKKLLSELNIRNELTKNAKR